jgi:hypothetical protein
LYSEILGENLGSKKAVGDDGQPRTYQSLGHVARYYATLNLKVHVFTRGRRTSYICAASSTFLLSPLRFAAKIFIWKDSAPLPAILFYVGRVHLPCVSKIFPLSPITSNL